jgi:hypothetical protein
MSSCAQHICSELNRRWSEVKHKRRVYYSSSLKLCRDRNEGRREGYGESGPPLRSKAVTIMGR